MGLATIWHGNTPPANPTSDLLWLSSSLLDARPMAGVDDRSIVLNATVGWEGTGLQEPTVWYNTATNQYNMLYAGNFTTARIGFASAPHPKGPWTKFSGNPVIGGGAASFANNAYHGTIYIEGGTLYFYFVDATANTTINVATSTMANPTVWTTSGLGNPVVSTFFNTSSFGSPRVFKLAPSSYVMFLEAAYDSAAFQMTMLTATNPLGPWTVLNYPMYTLWPNPQVNQGATNGGIYGTVSGAQVFQEGNTFIMYYHGGADNPYGAYPTFVYRAYTTDPALMNWTVDLVNQPFIRQVKVDETEQIANVAMVQDPGQGWWAFYGSNNNEGFTVGNINVMRLQQTLKQWDGVQWSPIVQVPTGNGYALDLYQTAVLTAAYIAVNQDEVNIDPGTTANMAVNLPRAAANAVVRINNVGNGTGSVLPTATGGDAITSGAVALTKGQSGIYRCKYPGRWNVGG